MHARTLARRRSALPALALLVLFAAGCGSRPPGLPDRDGPPRAGGPEPAPPGDVEPRVEALRPGGPNKPYEVLGRRYVPETRDLPLRESGLASWYGRKFHGRRTASGEVYDMHALTAAHKTMPLPSYARVRNPRNGREIVVRINDRGPFVAGRVIDLSWAAAVRLDLQHGIGPVEVERLTHEAIRSGAWRRRGVPSAVPDEAVATGAPSDTAAGAPGWWMQLGAFREREGAADFRQRVAAELDWLAPLLAVVPDAPLFRLQAGPYASRAAAQGAAERVREALALVPLVVERR